MTDKTQPEPEASALVHIIREAHEWLIRQKNADGSWSWDAYDCDKAVEELERVNEIIGDASTRKDEGGISLAGLDSSVSEAGITSPISSPKPVAEPEAGAVERLEEECFALAANQCHAGYGDEGGSHRCKYQDEIATSNKIIRNLYADLSGYVSMPPIDRYLSEAAMRHQKPVSGWQPKRQWLNNGGMSIVRSTFLEGHVFFQGKNGDVWRVWLDDIGQPLIECSEYNASLPKQESSNQTIKGE